MEESRDKSGSPGRLGKKLRPRFLKQMAPAAQLAVSKATEVCEEVGPGDQA